MDILKLILILKEWNPIGIYLKWFNANGGIHTVYSDVHQYKTIDENCW
jgi:hypothetical protein